MTESRTVAKQEQTQNQHPQLALALIMPDIPQNTGAIMRLCAGFGVQLHLIAPYGFIMDDRRLARAVMDYRQHLSFMEHAGWPSFRAFMPSRRRILLETDGDIALQDFIFNSDDILCFGSESRGTPREYYKDMQAVLRINLQANLRSLNLSQTAAISLFTALFNQKGCSPLA